MKQVSLTLYTFDELTPEVQDKVIDRERFNIMDRQMEISNSSFRKHWPSLNSFSRPVSSTGKLIIVVSPTDTRLMRLMRIVLIMSGKMAKRFLANFRLKNSAASC